MLKADGSYILPENVPANEFLNLEGDKISTSKNWAVWLHEYLEEFPGKQDVLRYVLCANSPEAKDNDFTWKDYQTRNNNELVAVLGNFVNRALVLTHKYFDGKVPEAGDLTDFDKDIIAQMPKIKDKVETSLENFRLREALAFAMEMARLGNKYLAESEPWKLIKTDEARVKTILNISIQITANLSTVIEAFLPDTAKKLREFLNINVISWEDAAQANNVAAGHQTNKPSLLFEKVEDSQVEFQVEKLHKAKAANEAANAEAEPQKPNVSFDDFTKMDIRIGTILEAKKVAKTKKLLQLKIDTGIDTRTVVSGIAEYYEPEKIIGKQVSILVNLETRKIRGIESQGMILMAEDADGTLRFVEPSENTKEGSQVS
jgi:methionyl-tRNA synthetase